MKSLKLEKLIEAISRNQDVAWSGELAVLPSPSPYIPPRFSIISSTAGGTTAAKKLAVEVIVVQAPAAVGKSITAQYLSSSLNVPVLNLANIGVGINSLNGSISTSAFYGGKLDHSRSIDDFCSGASPVIIDALDEGQMISGQKSFEGFLDSTAKLILGDRAVRDKPKVVFFGRPEAAEFSNMAVEIAGNNGENITICVVELEFFRKAEATELIKAYAGLEGPSRYDDLIEWYFKSIEKALHISEGKLWEDPEGRCFTGYAPVLSAIGGLLVKIDQPHVAIQDLQNAGEETAWGVIEHVMQYILKREQQKITGPLKVEFGDDLDSNVLEKAYGSHEQLTYLAQLLQGKSIELTNDVRFSIPAQNQRYAEHVETFHEDHAFIRQKRAANDVFESYILTNGIRSNFLTEDSVSERLEHLSRYPFLWRCFWHSEQAGAMGGVSSTKRPPIEGKYIGFILRSYCSDPLTDQQTYIYIDEGPRDATPKSVRITGRKGDVHQDGDEIFDFVATLPIRLFGDIRNCDIDLRSCNVEIVGDSKKDGARTFRFLGENSINCDMVEFRTEWIAVNGSLLVETSQADAPNPGLKLSVEGKLQSVGAISRVLPWNNWATERDVSHIDDIPEEAVRAYKLLKFIETKLGGNRVLSTNDRNEIDTGDRRTRWLTRSEGYQQLLDVLLSTGLASRKPAGGAGTYNHKFEFPVSLEELMEARDRILDARKRHVLAENVSRKMREFWRRYGVQ